MNEDVFNASLRRFLKKVGITSQREIEKSVRDALASGRLKGHEKLPAKMVLTIGAPPTVINAVLDALAPLGVNHIDMPATPMRVWQSIAQAQAGQAAA